MDQLCPFPGGDHWRIDDDGPIGSITFGWPLTPEEQERWRDELLVMQYPKLSPHRFGVAQAIQDDQRDGPEALPEAIQDADSGEGRAYQEDRS